MKLDDNLFWRRLHSFTGALPLGAFLVFHLYTNSFSAGGAAHYNEHIQPLRELPYLIAIEIAFIYIPLLYHSVYGIYVWSTSKANPIQYGYARNRLYTAQRLTGIIAFVFIAFHVVDQRLKPVPSFESVAASIANPFVLWLYIVGIAATAWHLFNGVWNVFIKWGVTVGMRAQEVMLWVFSVMGVGLAAMGLVALSGFMR